MSIRVAIFSTHPFERGTFDAENARLPAPFELIYFDARLDQATTSLARDFSIICAFVSDTLNEAVVESLAKYGVRLIALRSAGFNHVDLGACHRHGIKVVRVPAYSPYAVAEHAVCLVLALNRKIHRAYQRVKELNFSLDGLVGFDIHGKTVGIVGTGKIGTAFARIMQGFGAVVLAHDPFPNQSLIKNGCVRYVTLDELCSVSDIISLHCPLVSDTHHLINLNRLKEMKRGVMLINTGRGALIDTRALINGLKSGHIGAAGLDVYEEEEGVFFYNLSDQVLQDDVLARLLTFPNVLITAHQAFLTKEALHNIAETTLGNIAAFEAGEKLANEVAYER